jgi:hypothetical protein
MSKKRTKVYIGFFTALAGVLVLGIDKIFVSADSSVVYAKSFTVLTIIGVILLMAAAIWLYKFAFD